MATRIQIRRDTATKWAANNPVLALGEPGLETDTFIIKYGDGSSAWNDLPYANVDSLADFTTSDLTEGNRLYFSNARVYANILTLGHATNAQLATYATNAQVTTFLTNAQMFTYVINQQFATNNQLTLYATNAQLASYATNNQLTNYVTTATLSTTTTAGIAESGNLYYTNVRVYDNVTVLGFATNAQLTVYSTNAQLASYATNAQLNLYATNSYAISQLSQIYWPAVTRLSVTNSGASAYSFNSHYSTNNPNVYAISGTTISFSLNVAGHPFLLQEDSGSGYSNIDTLQLFHYTTAGVLTTASSAQGQVTGTLYWNVPFGTSNTYRYICGIHSNMVGNVIVKDISVI